MRVVQNFQSDLILPDDNFKNFSILLKYFMHIFQVDTFHSPKLAYPINSDAPKMQIVFCDLIFMILLIFLPFLLLYMVIAIHFDLI